ncbi:MAG TPA: response regulator [Gemmataceae bacterium]|nr:response regulator [Gemmataceae bacterium]
MADKANILVVDDLADNLVVARTVLEELGQNIVTARSGPEALRRVLEQEFAVILLDVNMPGMDGYETASLIRGRKRSAHTPIIFVTAYADEMNTVQGYALGAVDYVLSPMMPEVLRTKVRVFVDLHLMTQQVRRQADERVALARSEAARAAAEDATRRSNFLAEASKALSGSLDLEATVSALARLPVPFLADLGAVTVVGEPGRPWRTELAWVNPPEERVHTAALEGGDAPHDELRAAVERVLAGSSAVTVAGVALSYPPESAGGAVPGGPPIRSAIVLPLTARGRTLGALTLAVSDPKRSASAHDIALARDFAARAAIALDNARLYREVQEADRKKNEFLAMLAHELRNPLAPIRNGIHLLRAVGTRDPQVREVRDMMERQVQHLIRLVDDLLDLSRITRGKVRLQAEPLDLGKVLARAVETARPLIDERRHRLDVDGPAEALRVEGDAVRLAQVLGNLLNNAAKYTEEGGQITLGAARDGDEAVVRVRDTGMGIPAEMLGSVFELFTQVDRSLDRSQGGLGIGLTLVRQLVEMHGGRVEAHSEGPGRGSEFVVRLPLLKEEPRPAAEKLNGSPGAARAAPGKSRKVLVVDDNRDAAESLGLLLEVSGHQVCVCHDGASALRAAGDYGPDAVLLDIGLPGMDGYEIARRLRADPATRGALLIALTGYGQVEDQQRAREAGFDYHLIKPADLEALTGLLASPPAAVRA